MAGGTERVALRGHDARTYLDSQCTQDLALLAVGEVAHTLVLEPRGELVTIAAVTSLGEDHLELEVPAGTGAATVARLERFAIRTEVTFELGEGRDASPAEELDRIRAGRPGAAELARGLVPHALAAGLLAQTVSFTKGCYPGQELVARMHARHALPPYLLRALSSPARVHVGDAVGDTSRDGAVTSVAHDPATGRWHALCVVHRRDAESSSVDVTTATGVVAAQLDE